MNAKRIWYLTGALSLTLTLLVSCNNQKEETKAPETAAGQVHTEAAPQQNVQVQTAAANDTSFSEAMMKEGHGMQHNSSDAALMGSTKAIVPYANIKVEKAAGDNAFTIEEVYAKAAELNGKTIRVRGEVMKASPNIMGKNWIHIQDGTGNTLQNTHDLVLTTKALPDKGDILVFEGKLSADKDFGAGYRYDAIIEDAVIAQ